jgi:Flp pilus assembly protein CpaB
MRRRMFLILALVIFVVAGVVYIVFQYLPSISSGGSGSKTPTPAVTTMNIVFVAQDIPAGTLITADSVTTGPWPSTYPLPGLVTDKAQVVGKRARIDLRRGEPVFSSQLAESGSTVSDTASPLALKIKPGKVAIAVPMSRLSGVAYGIGNGDHIMVISSFMLINLDANFQTDIPNHMLLAGIDSDNKINFVDVIGGRIFKESPLSDVLLATYYVPIEAQRPRLTSAILVQDARILSVGNANTSTTPIAPVATTPAAGGNTATTPTQTLTTPDILVIEVSPEEALAINFLIRLRADLTYALRSAGDTTVFSIPSMDLKRLMDDFKIDLPPSLAFGTAPRIDQPYIPILGNDIVVQAR